MRIQDMIQGQVGRVTAGGFGGEIGAIVMRVESGEFSRAFWLDWGNSGDDKWEFDDGENGGEKDGIDSEIIAVVVARGSSDRNPGYIILNSFDLTVEPLNCVFEGVA